MPLLVNISPTAPEKRYSSLTKLAKLMKMIQVEDPILTTGLMKGSTSCEGGAGQDCSCSIPNQRSLQHYYDGRDAVLRKSFCSSCDCVDSSTTSAPLKSLLATMAFLILIATILWLGKATILEQQHCIRWFVCSVSNRETSRDANIFESSKRQRLRGPKLILWSSWGWQSRHVR